MKLRKTFVTELILIVVFVVLAIISYNYDFDLIVFKLYTQKTLDDKKIELENKMSELETTRGAYKTSLSELDKSKKSYADEKAKYDAISEETISMLNNATMGEEYNIDFIWITLGNYAKQNNLSIVLYEPEVSEVKTKASKEDETTAKAAADTTTTATTTATEDKKEEDTGVSKDLANRSKENFRVQVTGTYLNVSEFFYNVENDSRLRFNIDNIRMEYTKSNNIIAIFEVKDLVFNK